MIEDPRIKDQQADHPENGYDADHRETRQPAGHDESVEETVDGLPVLSDVRTIERASPGALPVVQAAAAAATGFVAGAATIALIKRRATRKVQRSRSGPRRATDMLPIVASRTFLVDVHLIKPE
jgi:hypothetical protein